MKERPILFNAPMVRAIIEGHKVQTRRVIKDLPCYDQNEYKSLIKKCHYGQPGDRLWVREMWARMYKNGEYCINEGNPKCPCEGCYVEYRADTGNSYPGDWDEENAKGNDDAPKWKPSIHMFRKDSRVTLEITKVRIERLQNISDEDAIKEGIEKETAHGQELGWKNYLWHGHIGRGITQKQSDQWDWQYSTYTDNPIGCFSSLWQKINAKEYPWSSNPWVWVIDFRRIE